MVPHSRPSSGKPSASCCCCAICAARSCTPHADIVALKTIYDPYDGKQFGNLEANLRFLDGAGLLRPGVRVLEIGSGTGALLHTLRGRGLHAVGIEPNAALAAQTRTDHGAVPIARMSGALMGFTNG